MSRLLLGLNIDHIATLRNVRNTKYPDPIYAVCIAEQAGVDNITVHLRKDRRHITDQDLILIRNTVQTAMNLEIAVTDEMVSIACQLKPDYCCLVPENFQELTTESGLNVAKQISKLKDIIFQLTESGIRVSLFVDPDVDQITASYKTGVSYIELHTGLYASTRIRSNQILEYQRIQKSIQCAVDYGLKINVGHGLNYNNVISIAMLQQIQEVNIGHAIISRAVFCGLYQAIIDMKELLKKSRRG